MIVPRATHLFEEPGRLEEVAELALGWFTTYLNPEKDKGGQKFHGRITKGGMMILERKGIQA